MSSQGIACNIVMSSLLHPSDRQPLPLQAVHEFTGYTARWWAVAPHQVILLLTGSIVWVLAQLHIDASPTAWTLQKCPLSRAEFVRVQVLIVGY